MSKIVSLFFFLVAFAGLHAQQYLLEGFVTEEMSKKGLPGATVKLVGSDNSMQEVKADTNGNYVFPVGTVHPNTSYVVSASGLDIKTKDFPDGVLGNPKAKITTVGVTVSTNFHQDFILKKIIKCGIPPPLVVFKQDKAEFLNSTMLDSIEFMYRLMYESPNVTIEVTGNVGTVEKGGKKLALERAEAVRRQLESRGIVADRLSVAGNVESNLESNKLYADSYFRHFIPLEQFRTRVVYRILRKDYEDRSGNKAPEIKVTNSESEGGK